MLRPLRPYSHSGTQIFTTCFAADLNHYLHPEVTCCLIALAKLPCVRGPGLLRLAQVGWCPAYSCLRSTLAPVLRAGLEPATHRLYH